jgi:hypothetical protein
MGVVLFLLIDSLLYDIMKVDKSPLGELNEESS